MSLPPARRARQARRRSRRRQQLVAQLRADLARGALRQARGYLNGLIGSYPYDCELRALAGECLFRAGEQLSAGRHWFLSEREDADAQAAIALLQRYVAGDPVELFKELRLHPQSFGQFDSPAVNERLEALRQQLLARHFPFAPIPPPAPPRQPAGCGVLLALLGLLGIGLLLGIYAGIRELLTWLG